MKTNNKKRRFSVSFPADLLKQVDRLTGKTRRSRNAEIVYLVEKAIRPDQTEKQNA